MKKTIQTKKVGSILIFVLPALIPLFVFWIYPIFRSIWISFTDWDFMTPTYHIVFLDNYISLFKDSRFYNALWNTLIFTVGTLVPTIVIGLGLAVLLQKPFIGSGIVKFILFSPWITPTVAISIVWTWIFQPNDGLANMVLSFFGLPALKWISSSQTAMLSVIIVTVWKSMGYAMIFYLSALEKVPEELYEASALDGAGKWGQFFAITIPSISPTTFFLMIITMVNSLQAYDQIQILTQGGPSGSTRTLLYMYYQLGFQEFKMGQATAVAVVMIIITGIIVIITNGIPLKIGGVPNDGYNTLAIYKDRFSKNILLLLFSLYKLYLNSKYISSE